MTGNQGDSVPACDRVPRPTQVVGHRPASSAPPPGSTERAARLDCDKLDDQLKVIRQREHPDLKIGPHCDDPYTCPLHDHCWAFLPEQSVLDLYHGTKKGFGLLDQGVILLKDIPDNTKLTENQAIQRQVAVTGQPHIRKVRLREAIGRQGSIVAFNAKFEKGRLRECCEVLPNFAPWLAHIKGRFVDLLEPFRSFDYYHPKQAGSASMKAVLPALTGRGYEHLAIQEGNTASLEFLRVTFTEVPKVERQRVRRQLEEYCGHDTEGMIWIFNALRKL